MRQWQILMRQILLHPCQSRQTMRHLQRLYLRRKRCYPQLLYLYLKYCYLLLQCLYLPSVLHLLHQCLHLKCCYLLLQCPHL